MQCKDFEKNVGNCQKVVIFLWQWTAIAWYAIISSKLVWQLLIFHFKCAELCSAVCTAQTKARTLQMNSDWFPKFSDYFLTTFRWNFPLFSDQSWQKFLLWVTEYCQRRINTHRSLWILIINWNHLLFSAAALIIQLIDWSWWQHRVKNSNTQSKYGDIIHYHVDKSQNFY